MRKYLNTIVFKFSLAFAIGLFVSGDFPKPVRACLAHYVSFEEQVTGSPLIFVGEIISVEMAATPDRRNIHSSGSIPGYGLEISEPQEDDAPKCSYATVKVIRSLKGRSTDKTLKIKSGPISSCAPYEQHYTFTKGEKHIFILCMDKGGISYTMSISGSIVPLEDEKRVADTLDMAKKYRANFLEVAKRETPKTYEKAKALNEALIADSLKWSHSNDYSTTKQLLKNADATTVQIALALAWLEPYPLDWAQHPEWSHISWSIVCDDKTDITAGAKEYMKTKMSRIGISKQHIESYLSIFKKSDFDCIYDFPFTPPHLWNHRDIKPDVLTTDYIFRYHSYAHGNMYLSYAMSFPKLAKLEPERVKRIIPLALGGNHEKTKFVAKRTIQLMPGIEFVDDIFDQYLLGDKYVWQALVCKINYKRDDEGTARRFNEFIRIAYDIHTVDGVIDFWQSLTSNKCFERECINEAIERLGNNTVDAAIHNYILAAMNKHEPKVEHTKLTKEQYRDWLENLKR